MAIGALTAEEKIAARAAASSELLSLFSAEGVDEEIQLKFFHIQVTTLARFAVLAKGSDDLLEILKDEFEIDFKASLTNRVKCGNVQVAWQRASVRQEKSAELEGELTSKHMPRPLNSSEYMSMKEAFQKKWWPLEDKQLPGRSYLEARCDELEVQDFRAEALSKVISRDEDGDPSMQSYFDPAGRLQLKKGSVEVAMPANQEQLRYRLKLWSTAMIMLGMRNSNRPVLQGLCPQDSEDFVSYLLGEYVFGMTGLNAEGHSIAAPSWPQLLVYEYQIRKRMYHLMFNENVAAPAALKSAYKDPIIKERFFTTPIALSSTAKKPFNALARPADGGGKGNSNRQSPYGKGGKGKGKGKKGGKGKGGKVKAYSDVCYSFNNHWEQCNRKNCAFRHKCSRCYGDHPAYKCGNNDKPPETAGAGLPVQ